MIVEVLNRGNKALALIQRVLNVFDIIENWCKCEAICKTAATPSIRLNFKRFDCWQGLNYRFEEFLGRFQVNVRMNLSLMAEN